jgi:hypothetical protein
MVKNQVWKSQEYSDKNEDILHDFRLCSCKIAAWPSSLAGRVRRMLGTSGIGCKRDPSSPVLDVYFLLL